MHFKGRPVSRAERPASAKGSTGSRRIYFFLRFPKANTEMRGRRLKARRINSSKIAGYSRATAHGRNFSKASRAAIVNSYEWCTTGRIANGGTSSIQSSIDHAQRSFEPQRPQR